MKQFSHTRTITKTNLKKVPKDIPGVYRIRSASDRVLYIGKAKWGRLDERIWEHRGKFQKGTKFQFRTTPNGEATDRLQKKEIREQIANRKRRI